MKPAVMFMIIDGQIRLRLKYIQELRIDLTIIADHCTCRIADTADNIIYYILSAGDGRRYSLHRICAFLKPIRPNRNCLLQTEGRLG